MGSLDVSVKVTARDSLGRYLAKLHEAAVRTVEETVRDGSTFAKGIVPVRSGALQRSVHGVMLSSTTGGVIWGTNHWEVQDKGGPPHLMPGRVRFFWAREGREWDPGGSNMIRHPGNPGRGFVSATKSFVDDRFMEAARRNFS